MINLFTRNFIFCAFCSLSSFAQFQFSGKVNDEYLDATVYLSLLDSYKNMDKLKLENILATCKIDSTGEFSFKGNFLSEKDHIYSIHIDKCFDEINNSKHLLNKCVDSKRINFIANNTDNIYFSLNSLQQMLCDYSFSRNENIHLKKIDSLQENLLSGIENSLNQKQRELIFKNYFSELKNYAQTLDHPLAELYAFNLYANENEFSRTFYLEDLKNSNYYSRLDEKLIESYLGTYHKDYQKELQTNLLSVDKEKINYSTYILAFLLGASLLFNFYFFRKKLKKPEKIDVQKKLTPQELKIYTEIKNGLSNKQIADKLFISLSTVKTHINNIYSKLKISSRKELLELKQ